MVVGFTSSTGVDAVANLLLEANIVVGELAHIGIIDTKNLGLLRSTEAETRDEMHGPEDDSLETWLILNNHIKR